MSLAGFLAQGGPPARLWTVSAADADAFLQEAAAGGGLRLRQLEGRTLATEEAFFQAIADALSFPGYFGRNWDALDECLADLAWIDEPAVLLVIRNADRFLADSKAGLRTFLDILAALEAEAASPTLRLLLQAEPAASASLRRRVGATGHALPAFQP